MTIAKTFLRGSATIGSEGSQSGSLRLTAWWTFQVEADNGREGRTMNGVAAQASEQRLVGRTLCNCAPPVAVPRLDMPPLTRSRERELVQSHYWLPTGGHAVHLQDGGESVHRCCGILVRVSSATVRQFLL